MPRAGYSGLAERDRHRHRVLPSHAMLMKRLGGAPDAWHCAMLSQWALRHRPRPVRGRRRLDTRVMLLS